MLKNNNDFSSIKHIAIIMDGNGRWATKKGLSRVLGHKKGLKSLVKIINFSIINKLNILTLYAFSTENWSRSKLEVSELMRLFSLTIKKLMYNLHKKNVCVNIIGNKKNFHFNLKKNIENIQILTKDNNGLKLNIAIDYGGKWDIVNCIKKIIKKNNKNIISIKDIDENLVKKNLCLGNLPSVDLLIRTGGEKRISNFLLWQIAYAEIFFINILWPDFSCIYFKNILNNFFLRNRKFGKN